MTRGVAILAVLSSIALAGVLRAAGHSGTVTASGVPVPGATVTATQGDTTRVTSTNEQGAYLFPGLDEGAWTIRVEMPGFTSLARDVAVSEDSEDAAPEEWELELLSFAEITRDLPLPPPSSFTDSPGQTSSTGPALVPGVEGTPPGLRLAAGTFSQAVVSQAAAAPPPAETAAPTGTAAVFGAADGLLISGSVNNGAASPFAQSGAFGNNRPVLGGRPYNFGFGLNARSSAWDASPSTFGRQLATVPDYTNLNVSGSFSGRVWIPGLPRNATSFTLTYQRSTDQRAPTSSALLPTALERQGDFSQTRDAFGSPVTVVDPATGLPFPDNAIPADRISPQAAALLAFYPAPNLDDVRVNYQRALPVQTVRDNVAFNLNTNVLRTPIAGRVQVNRNHAGSANLFGFDDDMRGWGVDASITITRRVNPFLSYRVGQTFNHQNATTTPYFAYLTNISGNAGITGTDQDPRNWGPPTLTFSSVANLSTGQYAFNRTQTYATTGELFWNRGRHAFTMGGNVNRHVLDVVSQENPRGSFFFDGGATGSDFADFLLGVPRTSRIAYGNADKYFRAFSYAAYIMDDYRIGPSLTVNLGLRWEYEAPYTEEQGRLVNLDVAPDFSAVSQVVASNPVGPLSGRVFASSLVRPDKRGIQPRVSVAWRPVLGSSVLVRAGYGIYRNNGLYQSLARALAQQPPLSFAVSAEQTPETPLTLANGFIPSPAITSNTYAIDPDFRVSYGHVWQASVQRDLPSSLTMVGTYVGTRGVNLVQQFLPNTYAPGAVNPCPSCPIGFAYVTSHGTSFRNSGQIQIRRRLRAGLTASAQYTLAKGTDNAATFSGTSGTSAQDWRDLDAEHGPSFDDQRHQFGTQVQYSTGIGAAGGAYLQGLLGRIVRGWTITGQFVIGSGRPLTPVYGVALPGTAVNGTVRAALTGAPVDGIPDGYYLNPFAYTAPAAGEWGTAGRNSLRGPKQFSLDAGVTRSFRVHPRLNVDWRIDATNLLNRVTYTSVNTIVNSPQFGLATSTGEMRRIQTSVQMRF